MSHPKKQKTIACQPEIKLPMALIMITCPDKGCMKCFKTERGRALHFDKSPGCAQAITKVLQCLQTQQLSNPLALARQTQTADESIEIDNASDPIGFFRLFASTLSAKLDVFRQFSLTLYTC